MRSRLYDDELNSLTRAVQKMFNQLDLEFHKQTTQNGSSVLFFSMKENKKIFLTLKTARKGFIKCTVEVQMPVNSIADYEFRKTFEISLLNSLEAFVGYEEKEVLGV